MKLDLKDYAIIPQSAVMVLPTAPRARNEDYNPLRAECLETATEELIADRNCR